MEKIKVDYQVKVLRGKYKGENGVVIKNKGKQYDVKMLDGNVRYLESNDIEKI